MKACHLWVLEYMSGGIWLEFNGIEWSLMEYKLVSSQLVLLQDAARKIDLPGHKIFVCSKDWCFCSWLLRAHRRNKMLIYLLHFPNKITVWLDGDWMKGAINCRQSYDFWTKGGGGDPSEMFGWTVQNYGEGGQSQFVQKSQLWPFFLLMAPLTLVRRGGAPERVRWGGDAV